MMPDYSPFMIAAVLTCLTVMVVSVGYMLARRTRSSQLFELNRNVSADGAIDAVILFAEQVGMLREKRNVIDAHVSEYFHTLQEAGWPQLQTILVKLTQAESQLREMIHEEQYVEASELANFLLDRTAVCDFDRICARYVDFTALVGWQQESERLILQLVQQLEVAAVETQGVGVSRQRKRQPTLLSISEIRDMLLNQRGA